MSNGFLQGIDGAAKLMSIYHGVRDREDNRKQRALENAQKQKEWDWKVSTDARNFEHDQYKTKEGFRLQERGQDITMRGQNMSNALGWANHNLSKQKYVDEQNRLTQESGASGKFFDMMNNFGGAIGHSANVPNGGSLSVDGAVSNITDEVLNQSLGGNGQVIPGSGNAGAILFKERGLTPEGLGWKNAPNGGRLSMVSRPNGTIDVIYSAVSPAGDIVSKPVDGATGLTTAQAEQFMQGSGSAHAFATDNENRIAAQNASAQAKKGMTFADDVNWTPTAISRGARPAEGDLSGSAKTLADVTSGIGNIATAKTVEPQVKEFENSVSNTANATAQEFAQQEQTLRNEYHKRLVGELSELEQIAKNGNASTRQEAYKAAKAIQATGKTLADGALELYSQLEAEKTAARKGELESIQNRAKSNTTNKTRSGDYLDPKDVENFAKTTAGYIDKQFGSNSPHSGKSFEASRKMTGWIQDTFGGITYGMDNDQAFKSMAQNATKLMVTKGIDNPAAAVAIAQRYGSDPTDAQILEVRDAFDGLRKAPGITEDHLQPAVLNRAIKLMGENKGEISELPDYVKAAHATMSRQ